MKSIYFNSTDDSQEDSELKDDVFLPLLRYLAEEIEEDTEVGIENAKKFAPKLCFDKHRIWAKDKKGSLFQIAMQTVKTRKLIFSGVELNLTKKRTSPKLLEMSIRVLAENTDKILSLELVPDDLKSKIASVAASLGKMDRKFIHLLVEDSSSEIVCRDCSDLREEDLDMVLFACDSATLDILILDGCGPIMTELAIKRFLQLTPDGFPSLTTLSLKGAFFLTDDCLALIARSAPLLEVIDVADCSLLTSRAIQILANYFGSSLTSLNIERCVGIKSSFFLLNEILKFTVLNYVSFRGLENYRDTFFVCFLRYRFSNLTHLSLAYCNKLTDGAIENIGIFCPNLESLDISGLDNLTDFSLESIADFCPFLNSINMAQTQFSDEAIAAFIEVLGGSLEHLCLMNVRNVGQNTAFSVAKVCKKLRHMDLSWCLRLSEKELKHILSSCSSLRSVWLYGWTKVTTEFVKQAKRSDVEIKFRLL